MTDRSRRLLAACCIALLTAPLSALPAHAAARTGRIVGTVTSATGRPAPGWDVLIVSHEGDLVAHGASTATGVYEIDGVPPGSYRVGVRDLQGHVSAVQGPPARVTGKGAVLQDIRLHDGSAPRLAPAVYGARADSWWDRQTRNQKIFTIVGSVVGAAALWAIVDHYTGNDKETPASPY